MNPVAHAQGCLVRALNDLYSCTRFGVKVTARIHPVVIQKWKYIVLFKNTTFKWLHALHDYRDSKLLRFILKSIVQFLPKISLKLLFSASLIFILYTLPADIL